MKHLIKFIIKNCDLFARIFFILFTAASILVSVNRFWQYEVFYYDFGIFDRAIWLASKFKPPVIDHLVVGGKIIFADHFNPSIFLYSPIYWFANKPEALLIAQALTAGLSGLFIYKIGKIVTKNNFFSLSILISYFLFVGLQNALISDFHEVTVATFFSVLCFYFFLKNKKNWSLLFLIIFLGFKESNFLFGIGFAVAFFLLNKSWRKFSVFLLVFSLIWGILSIKLIIPYFAGGIYGYDVVFSLDKINLVNGLLGTVEKRQVVFYSLLSFGFLPILAPIFWFLIVQDFLVRFLSNRVSLGLHYSALLSVILALSSIYGFSFLQKIKIIKKYLIFIPIIIILNAVFLYRFVLRGPLALSYNPDFYANTKNFKFLDTLVSQIPSSMTVMAQNNLASHFTHQKNIWVLKDNYELYKPDYIVLDLRSGQNVNDFFPTKNPSLILDKLLHDKKYSPIFNNGNQYIFIRKGN